ncbi:MAG: AAC(3) family N-acetyltransferase [Proteobacteria bacterium]|nr:AAC(3) family N-acetyltransferase [Pseudomonadota bacterium]
MKNKIYSFFKAYKSKKKLNAIRQSAEVITKDRIIHDLIKIGVRKGDLLFLHSSLARIGYVDGGADTVASAIMETIGPEGTLIVPTYSMKESMYKTCMDNHFIFDVRKDTRGLGAIPAAVLRTHDVRTSIHPTHCTSSVGKDALYITESHHMSESTFGKDSPWERWLRRDGKLLGLGISMGPVTFYHTLEDLAPDQFPIPVRMKNVFPVKCINWQGDIITVPVRPLDPKFMRFRIDHKEREDLRTYFRKEFTQAGIVKQGLIGRASSWIAPAEAFYRHLNGLMKEGITIYATATDLKRRPVE